MLEEISKQFLVYGPLGLVAVIQAYAIIALYKAKETQTKENQVEIRRMQDQHRVELDALMQRHVGKAETWVEKGHELAQSMHAVLESIEKRLQKRGS